MKREMPGALPQGAALVVLGPGGLATAARLKPLLPGAELHGLAARLDGADVPFAEAVPHLQALFRDGRPIVGLCAAGILVRALAPLLADKREEPPVLALAEDGSAVVPLLGGHHGGNALARAIAGALGCAPAITTAGELRLGLALDDPPAGWRLANPEAVKAVTAALLAGEPVALVDEAGAADWLAGAGGRFAADGDLRVRVTDRGGPAAAGELVLHPPTLALGVGCERDTDPAELATLVARTLAAAGLAKGSVAGVFSIDLKADESAVHALAAELGVPARFFDAATLEAEAPRLAAPSELVFRETGCHGVAEGAALAAAGPEGALVVAKTKSARATCAVARAPAPLAAAEVGRARGSLAVIGIGPGTADWRTPEAAAALAAAGDVVGYRLYLDLLGPAVAGKALHAFELGEEEARARLALALAGAGRRVALVSSGDAGIYAMAALVFELLDREGAPAWQRIALSVVPGVSALQAAAARAGAPLGHDFCAVSLSDLMTPWSEIERRLEAAAAGDFVVALYNPVSRRRRQGLAKARDILARARPPETPVVLARNLGRCGESVEYTSLAELDPDRADMLTLVLVGSSASRRIVHGRRVWVYTPRGYGGAAS